jgi:hypothetical protein
MPQLLVLGAHAFEHHGHEESRAGYNAEWPGLAHALMHGHEHEEGVPEHEHHLLPSPPVRPDAPRDLQAPALAYLEVMDAGHLLLSSSPQRWEETRLSGSSPPRLHLLCTLLI